MTPTSSARKSSSASVIYTIVGVAPPEFFGTLVGEAPEVWLPLSMIKVVPPYYGGYNDNFSKSLNLIGRLKPGVSIEQATANGNLLFQQITRSFPDAKLTQLNLAEARQSPRNAQANCNGAILNPLPVLSTPETPHGRRQHWFCSSPAPTSPICCWPAPPPAPANSPFARPSAQAARASSVSYSPRASCSPSPAARWESHSRPSPAGSSCAWPPTAATTIPVDLSIDGHLLLFNLGVTVTTALIFGTIPALRATRLQLTDTLKASRTSNNSSSKNRLAQALIISQVSLSLVLMVGAGLFLRSLVNLSNVDPGFNKQNVLRLQIDSSDITGEANQNALFHQIEDRVNALPNVRAASFSTFTFGAEGAWNSPIQTSTIGLEQNINATHNNIGNGYFTTMGIPLIAGRNFTVAGHQDLAPCRRH